MTKSGIAVRKFSSDAQGVQCQCAGSGTHGLYMLRRGAEGDPVGLIGVAPSGRLATCE
jgi:hypothetical protein